MNSPCDGMFSSLVSLSLLISQQIEKYQNKIPKKISKKCKELNKLKQLKISDDIKKILEYELSNKRASYDRTMNKCKGIRKPY